MARTVAAILVGVVFAAVGGPARAQPLVVVGEPGVAEPRISAVVAALRARDHQVVELLAGPAAAAAIERNTIAAIAAVTAGLEDARTRYIELDLDAAIANLEKIEAEEATSLLGDPRGIAALADLNLWLGNLLIASRRRGEAEARFRQAVALRADLEIDRASFPPEVTRVFDEVKQRPATPIGSLTVDSRPEGAVVAVDGGRRREKTPVTVAAAGGWHYVSLHLAGFRPWAQRIEMVGGEVKSLPLALTPAGLERVSADIAALMVDLYPDDRARAVVLIARAAATLSPEGRMPPPPMARPTGPTIEVVVVGAASIIRYRDDGKPVATVSGSDVDGSTDALFAAPLSPRRERGRRLHQKWWFWTALGGAVVTSAVLIYAVTDDDTLRGRFSPPQTY